MRGFPVLISLLALGAAAFAFLVAQDAARTGRDRATADAAFEARLAALELAASARAGDRGAPAPIVLTTGGPDGAPALASGARPPATPAELERRLAELEKAAARRAEAPAPASTTEVAAPQVEHRWIGSLDDAATAFDLAPGQKADMDRILADGRREVDALRKLPDDAGTTWEAVEKDVVKMVNGSIQFDNSKLSAFREKVIPGRAESFGGAMRRIREDTARRLKETLSPTQREAWDKSMTGGLLPGSDDGGGFGFIAFGASTSTLETSEPEPAMDAK